MSKGHAAGLVTKPSLIEYKHCRFLITDAPTNQNLPLYIEEFRKQNVTTLVRTCDRSYSDAPLTSAGIEVHELPFPDGAGPPSEVVARWLAIVGKVFSGTGRPTIAIHCVAGLGRAPVLVAVALIEAGMPKMDTISYIRERRPRAFNLKQINYLEEYKRHGKKCVIM